MRKGRNLVIKVKVIKVIKDFGKTKVPQDGPKINEKIYRWKRIL
mgnify:CR=1 FL=1